jgi:O-acetyl-ADP-ribose deacetylase (regulator of RNase III)
MTVNFRQEIAQGDITAEAVDAIVNAANSELAPGAGVCGAIHRAGGPTIWEECRQIGHCPTGGAVATTGGNLTARFVIHAVGPVWRGGTAGEDAQLASAYRSSLDEAARVGARSVAFPAISTGVYGYPPEVAAAVAVAAVSAWGADHPGSSVELVRFVAFDSQTRTMYEQLMNDG